MDFWQTEDIFFDGDLYFEKLIEDIRRARHEITIEIYIFSYDELGKRVIEALGEAQKRGVRVSIIVDGVGSYHYFDKLAPVFQSLGIEAKVYHPLPFYHPIYGSLDFKQKITAYVNRLLKLNKRNHRKVITIDHEILYIGSFNITAEHTSLAPDKKWKDVGARVTGKQALEAVMYFKRTFKLREFYRYKKKYRGKFAKHSPLYFNQLSLLKKTHQKSRFDLIEKATKRIWLTTPYFIPKHKIVSLLSKAASRGVDVRLITNKKSDVEIFRTLQFAYYDDLVKNGVKIYQFTDTILHAKTYMIDDWVSIGSTNLNHRSLIHDLEADIVIQEPKNKEMIARDFEKMLYGLSAITEEDLRKIPLWDRILLRIFYTFKYWF